MHGTCPEPIQHGYGHELLYYVHGGQCVGIQVIVVPLIRVQAHKQLVERVTVQQRLQSHYTALEGHKGGHNRGHQWQHFDLQYVGVMDDPADEVPHLFP